MGDRSNIQFRFGNKENAPTINLYSHWAGTELAAVAVSHLRSNVARGRWNDPDYLTRIVVHNTLNEMADPNSETGFGLGYEPCDNEHKILILDVENRTYELSGTSGTWEELCAMSTLAIEQMVE